MEATLKHLLLEYHQWAYLIVFIWCIFEGESALILAGIMAHEEHVDLILVIFVAGLGAFVGDQIYFYIGRYSKKFKWISSRLKKQRKKIAIAQILLNKYGWGIIFLQRYMYGFRTIIPISIGITRYDTKKFAIINLISGWAWASVTILLAWYFGEEIWKFISWAEKHWYLAIILVVLFLYGLYKLFITTQNKFLQKSIKKEKK